MAIVADIDLRREFNEFIEDNGWWMVIRSFNLARRSKYWNELSHEAVGGPQWEYNDIIFKGRRKENILGDVETYETRQQLTDIYNVIFYVISKIRPKKEDMVIEIPMDIRFLDTPPRNVWAHEVFDIKHVEAKIEKGLIYSKCYAKKSTPINDETLRGSFPVKHIQI